VSGNTLTYSVTDGQSGDDDMVANGTIIDPAGPGVPIVGAGAGAGAGISGVPTLSEWAMLALAGLMAIATFLTMRRLLS
jgi:hypothetical protein